MSVRMKYQSADFAVNELSSRQTSHGDYSLYRLHKSLSGTPEALQQIAHYWSLSPWQVSHSGLKDHRADTSQLIAVQNGPPESVDLDRIQLDYVGPTDSPLTSEDIIANQFSIRLRNIDPADSDRLRQRFSDVAANGFPNYFDSQRFGSVPDNQRFPAAAQCRRDFETAVRLALAEPNFNDRPDEQQQRQILLDHWGDWVTAKAELSRSNRRSVVTYLVDHPEGFRKAFALISPDYRGLLLSAFQSYVWNGILAAMIGEQANSILIAGHDYPVPTAASHLPERLPLPSSRLKKVDAAFRNAADQVLSDESLTLAEMKTHFPRDRWFSRANRLALVTVADFSTDIEDDDCFEGQHCLTLEFELPAGCYATMLIRSVCDVTIG